MRRIVGLTPGFDLLLSGGLSRQCSSRPRCAAPARRHAASEPQQPTSRPAAPFAPLNLSVDRLGANVEVLGGTVERMRHGSSVFKRQQPRHWCENKCTICPACPIELTQAGGG